MRKIEEMTRSPIAYFLFFLSGVTALVYEVIWTRMLALVFGHTVFSVSVVLAAFMAGLGFGSYLFGSLIDTMGKEQSNPELRASPASPLIVYGTIEILVFASSAILSLVFSRFSIFYSGLHTLLPDSPVLFDTVKAILAFVLMFIPTTLMGATLPVISKYYVIDDRKLDMQVGLLYFINTFGAAAGCLLTGFVFISAVGVLQTALYASLINLVVGVGAIRIYQESTGDFSWYRFPKLGLPSFRLDSGQRIWIGVSFVCGFTALAYEVLWTRLLVFSMAGTVYAFSMMLAIFLLGIALGSLLVIPCLRHIANLRTLLIIIQAGIGFYLIVSLYTMESLLSSPWNGYNLRDPAETFARYFKESAALMLIPTMLFGMAFPVLIKLVSGDSDHVGRGTGQVYISNTLGAIMGSLVAGFVLLPKLGSEKSLTLVAMLNFLPALALFRSGDYLTLSVRKGMTTVMACVLLYIATALPGNLLDSFFMRDSTGKRDPKKLLYFEEGVTDTVAVFTDDYGVLDPTAKRLITNGISMSAVNEIASRYMKLLAHIPILLSDNPEDVLVICFGTGQTTGAAAIHPRVKSVDSVELSPSVVHAGIVFAKENDDVLRNPKVHTILQDGRNHLLTTSKRYDVITAEPPPPHTLLTVNLYTREYYEQARSRLKPGGIVAQWVPLHSQSEREVAMHFRTFRSAFSHVLAWLPVANEMILIGSDRAFDLDFLKVKERLEALPVAGIHDVYALLGNIWLLEDQLDKLGAGKAIISDNHPRIEFYLDSPDVIGTPGLEKMIFNRAPFAEIADRIQHLPDDARDTLRSYYQAMGLYQRGVVYGNRGQLLEALALVEDGELIRYHLQATSGQIQRLVRQLEQEPGNVGSLLNLGHAYYQLGDYHTSAEFLRLAGEKDPKQSYADLYLAYNLMEMGRRDEAGKYFESAVRKDPRYMRTVMQDMGLIDLLNKLEKKRNDPGLINAAAQFYNIKSEYRKSIGYSLEILEKDPVSSQALQNLVFSYLGLGEPAEVFDYGKRYYDLNPDDLHIQYILAEMYMKTLDCEKAIPYLKNILKKDDSYRNAQSLLNECEETGGSQAKRNF